MSYNFNKTLLIVNPVSQLGQGKYAGEKAHNFFLSQLKEGGFGPDFKLDTVEPDDPQHATKIASEASTISSLLLSAAAHSIFDIMAI